MWRTYKHQLRDAPASGAATIALHLTIIRMPRLAGVVPSNPLPAHRCVRAGLPFFVRTHMPRVLRHLPLLSAALLACGCATRPAPDISGRWHPVNHYARDVQAIPLHAAYVYAASPMDATLKAMLERWATDSHRSVSYEAPADYTLPQAVADVRSSDVDVAIAALNAIYATQQLHISVDGNRITVARAEAAPPTTEAAPVPGA
jgi:hypothetical protein